MVVHGVGHRILRVPLAMPVIIDYQIAGQPHQPVRQVALFGVVLVERPVDADKTSCVRSSAASTLDVNR